MNTQVAIIRSVGGLVFDATFEEKHTSELEVTDNPVETGVTVSDHAYMKPVKLTIAAGVTDTPLSPRAGDQFQGASRSKAAYDLLLKLQVSAEPFDIQTGLKLYHNMICSSIRVTQDKETSAVLSFEADFREVLIVSTQTVKYPPRKAGSTSRQANPAKSKGEQQGSQQDGDKKASLLKKLSDTLTGGGLLR